MGAPVPAAYVCPHACQDQGLKYKLGQPLFCPLAEAPGVNDRSLTVIHDGAAGYL
jgi:hypothetical protein